MTPSARTVSTVRKTLWEESHQKGTMITLCRTEEDPQEGSAEEAIHRGRKSTDDRTGRYKTPKHNLRTAEPVMEEHPGGLPPCIGLQALKDIV